MTFWQKLGKTYVLSVKPVFPAKICRICKIKKLKKQRGIFQITILVTRLQIQLHFCMRQQISNEWKPITQHETFFLNCTQLAITTLPLARAWIFCNKRRIYWEHKVIPERMRSKASVGWLLGCITTALKKLLWNINIILKNWTNQVTTQKPTDSLPVLSQKLQVLNGFEITGTSSRLILIFFQRTRASSSLILKYFYNQNQMVLSKFK